ncbi:hypothetical protein [Xenorhabdus bovienii]|uniref:hypothetical protein n=1 Tax=Xenorhabdus bovienii TaxID=40576 RepID=UPI00068E00D4|nr:hypothetical protein [Xenorhabdus bovienii]
MITFRHFLDRPIWAAVAGYDFNIIDCLSVAGCRYFSVPMNIWDELLDLEIRQMVAVIMIALSGLFFVFIYPLIFWVFGIGLYFNCKRYIRKYKAGKPQIVIDNLNKWKSDCDRRFKKK